MPISINNIKKREYEVKLDLIFLVNYYYYFLVYINYINNNMILIPDFVQVFKEEFSLQETEATKFSFLKDRYWYMSHYDKIKKGKRSHYLRSFPETKAKKKNGNENSIKKVPSLMDIKIIDQLYNDLIRLLATAYCRKDSVKVMKLHSTIVKRLSEVGWPQPFIEQKIKNDIQIILKGRKSH